MTTVLMVDEKWSVEFDPESNDRPIYWLRHGERHSPFNDHNDITALFYALSEARSDLASVQPAQMRVKPLVWTGGERVAATGLMLRMEGIFLDRDKVAQFEQERADEILSLLEPQPDPRDEVIARLVEALENRLHDPECPCNACEPMLAALAAAKAVLR